MTKDNSSSEEEVTRFQNLTNYLADESLSLSEEELRERFTARGTSLERVVDTFMAQAQKAYEKAQAENRALAKAELEKRASKTKAIDRWAKKLSNLSPDQFKMTIRKHFNGDNKQQLSLAFREGVSQSEEEIRGILARMYELGILDGDDD